MVRAIVSRAQPMRVALMTCHQHQDASLATFANMGLLELRSVIRCPLCLFRFAHAQALVRMPSACSAGRTGRRQVQHNLLPPGHWWRWA